MLAKAASQGSQVFARLAEVPLFLAAWGGGLFGEWLLVTAIPACLSLSDLGFAGAANREMAMRRARGDRDGALAVFRGASVLILALSMGLAGLFLGSVAALDLSALLGLQRIGPQMLALVMLCLALKLVIESQTRLLFGGFYCVQQYAYGFLVLAAIRLGQLGASALALICGGGPVAVALAMVLAELAGGVGMRLALRRRVPWLRYGLHGVRRADIAALLRPALAGMAIPLGLAVSHQGVRLVIGVMLGPAAVVVFTTHRQLTRMVSVVVSLAHPVQAELSALYDPSDPAPFRALSRAAVRLLVRAVLAVALGVALIGGMVFVTWTGGAVGFDPVLFGLLLAAAVAESLWLVVFPPVIAINRHIGVARIYLLLSAVLLPCVWAAAAGGLPAIAAVLVVLELVFFATVLRAAWQVTGDSCAAWLRAVLGPGGGGAR